MAEIVEGKIAHICEGKAPACTVYEVWAFRTIIGEKRWWRGEDFLTAEAAIKYADAQAFRHTTVAKVVRIDL